DLFLHALKEEWKQRDEAEASRLLYVAMTRAEKHLVLSFSASEKKPANWARVVAEKLVIDPAVPRDEVVDRIRVLVVHHAPEIIERPRTADALAMPELMARPVVNEQQDTNATV